jgi:NAD(P)-dependent dehydrogenase (short-subunit alcohol dehydrogenase family)
VRRARSGSSRRSEPRAARRAREGRRGEGGRRQREQLDVTAGGVPAKIRELTLKYGPFYGVVNNAGIAIGGRVREQSDDDVRQQFETNVFGLMAVTRAVLPSMRAAGRGRIVTRL